MDVSSLPFNRLIALEPAPADRGFLVTLPADPRYGNHLGTVHGSALLAVAEAGSGAFLAGRFGHLEGFVPMVRRLEAKFRKPATGRISARARVTEEEVEVWLAKLTGQGRLLAPIAVELVAATGAVVLTATVEWFITRGAQNR